ncbi:MAG: riboflavin synthase [bacterium]
MFTGLIEEVGTVTESVETQSGRRLLVSAQTVTDGLNVGDSMNVDGVCQTVVFRDAGSFACEAVGETLEKSTLGLLRKGDEVNLERAMRADTRMGGHMVQGHVSAMAEVRRVEQRGENWLLVLSLPEALLPLVVPEGSIAIHGASMTVASIDGSEIGINIVPHTAKHTTLVRKNPGDSVNIETDILGRYVERMLRAYIGQGSRFAADGPTESPDTAPKRENV